MSVRDPAVAWTRCPHCNELLSMLPGEGRLCRRCGYRRASAAPEPWQLDPEPPPREPVRCCPACFREGTVRHAFRSKDGKLFCASCGWDQDEPPPREGAPTCRCCMPLEPDVECICVCHVDHGVPRSGECQHGDTSVDCWECAEHEKDAELARLRAERDEARELLVIWERTFGLVDTDQITLRTRAFLERTAPGKPGTGKVEP